MCGQSLRVRVIQNPRWVPVANYAAFLDSIAMEHRFLVMETGSSKTAFSVAIEAVLHGFYCHIESDTVLGNYIALISRDPIPNASSMIEMATILKEITDLAMDAGYVIDR